MCTFTTCYVVFSPVCVCFCFACCHLGWSTTMDLLLVYIPLVGGEDFAASIGLESSTLSLKIQVQETMELLCPLIFVIRHLLSLSLVDFFNSLIAPLNY